MDSIGLPMAAVTLLALMAGGPACAHSVGDSLAEDRALAKDSTLAKDQAAADGGVAEPVDDPAGGDMAADLLAEMNRLRTEPKTFIPLLEAMKLQFRGNRLERPGEVAILTSEGVTAVDEAIVYLRGAKSLPPFDLSPGMSRAAADHVRDLSRSGKASHDGSDGSNPSTRTRRYGAWKKKMGENLAMGGKTGLRILFQQLIDDGVASRAHRINLFRAEFQVVGVACGTHPVYRTVCVVDFAGGFQEVAGQKRDPAHPKK